MRHDDHRGFLAGEPSNNLQDLSCQLRIQSRGGFIKTENIRLQCQCSGDCHALLLASGKLMRIPVHPVGQAHLIQELRRTRAKLFLTFAVILRFAKESGRQHDIFQGCVLRKQVKGLEHHSKVQPFPANLFIT